jgi:hypothetical protein
MYIKKADSTSLKGDVLSQPLFGVTIKKLANDRVNSYILKAFLLYQPIKNIKEALFIHSASVFIT